MRRVGLVEEIWSRRHTSSLIQNHLRCFSVPQRQIVPRNVRVVSEDRKHVLAWHKVNAKVRATAMWKLLKSNMVRQI